MIVKPLLKRDLKAGLKLSTIFIAILAMYTSIIIYMFDPEMAKMLKEFENLMPGMMSVMGMAGDTATLTAFIQTYLYGFLMIIVPMIFEIILINKFIMCYIDSGAMANLLATPHTRKSIIITQMLAILICIICVFGVTMGIGIGCSAAFFPGELVMSKYLMMNGNMLLIHFVISGIGFCAACFFNETKHYLAIGAGLPLGFYLIQMLGNMGGKLEWTKYFTLYTLFEGKSIIAGEAGVLSSCLMLLGIGIFLYSVGIYKFIKKDLFL